MECGNRLALEIGRATVVQTVKEATARPKPPKSDGDRILEIERGHAFHLVFPKLNRLGTGE